MVEGNTGQTRRLLTPGEIKFNERVADAQQLARQMELFVRPESTNEELDRFIRPRNNRDGEIGWSWYYTTKTEGRDVTGIVDLEIKNHRNADFIPTGDVTLTVARVAYMHDNRSQAAGGSYWGQTVFGEDQSTEVYQKAMEALRKAWIDVKELVTKLPEISRIREARKHEYFP